MCLAKTPCDPHLKKKIMPNSEWLILILDWAQDQSAWWLRHCCVGCSLDHPWGLIAGLWYRLTNVLQSSMDSFPCWHGNNTFLRHVGAICHWLTVVLCCCIWVCWAGRSKTSCCNFTWRWDLSTSQWMCQQCTGTVSALLAFRVGWSCLTMSFRPKVYRIVCLGACWQHWFPEQGAEGERECVSWCGCFQSTGMLSTGIHSQQKVSAANSKSNSYFMFGKAQSKVVKFKLGSLSTLGFSVKGIQI